MATRQDKIKSLQLLIEEQHRDYDYLLHIYNRMRATEGVLLTAVFAVSAYLYHALQEGTNLTIRQRFFWPAEDYGKVIYLAAAIAFAYATIKLMLNVFGNNPWQTAFESSKDNYSYDELETLEYIKSRYGECQTYNCQRYIKRKKELTFLFFCILISATILIVIKTLN